MSQTVVFALKSLCVSASPVSIRTQRIAHIRRYRSGRTERGEKTYTPRALIFERNENLGSLRPSGFVNLRYGVRYSGNEEKLQHSKFHHHHAPAQPWQSQLPRSLPATRTHAHKLNSNNSNRYLYHQQSLNSLDDFKASVPWSGDIETHSGGPTAKHSFQKVD